VQVRALLGGITIHATRRPGATIFEPVPRYVTVPRAADASSGGGAARSNDSSPYGSSSRIGTPKRAQISATSGRRSSASVLPVGFS
jgi:hypothetical protein